MVKLRGCCIERAARVVVQLLGARTLQRRLWFLLTRALDLRGRWGKGTVRPTLTWGYRRQLRINKLRLRLHVRWLTGLRTLRARGRRFRGDVLYNWWWKSEIHGGLRGFRRFRRRRRRLLFRTLQEILQGDVTRELRAELWPDSEGSTRSPPRRTAEATRLPAGQTVSVPINDENDYC